LNVSDNVEGPYQPINNDFIVRGSEKTGMYGTNFLQISTAPEEYIAYGWYHRLHALEVSSAYRVNGIILASIRITLAAACKAIATSHNLIWTP